MAINSTPRKIFLWRIFQASACTFMPKKWFCINPTCNQIQNVTVYLVSQVCKDVMVESPLQRLIGEGFYLKRWQIWQYRNQELLGSKCMEEKKTMQESRASNMTLIHCLLWLLMAVLGRSAQDWLIRCSQT